MLINIIQVDLGYQKLWQILLVLLSSLLLLDFHARF